jgi:hypothetical protein
MAKYLHRYRTQSTESGHGGYICWRKRRETERRAGGARRSAGSAISATLAVEKENGKEMAGWLAAGGSAWPGVMSIEA